jgi:hypothetical protein
VRSGSVFRKVIAMFHSRPLSLSFLLLLLSAVGGRAAENDQDRFEPMMNGQNLDGWVNVNCAPSTWSVRDGLIYCTGKPIGELRTNRMYQNFILEAEWRHLQPQGNAGIFVWADALPARGQPFHRAVEVQVLDGREGPGHTSDGDVFPIHGATMVPANGRGGGMRSFPTEKRSRPSPQWNHYRIECVDGNIRLAVNGKVVTEGSQCSPRKGYICLESEGSPVEFRNLKIMPLAGGELADNQVAEGDQGFVSLYNGVDLAGWKVDEHHQGHWQPKDWILAYDGQADGDDPNLWTNESFGDFQLIVDWRWPAPSDKAVARPVILPSGQYAQNDDGSPRQVQVPVADSGIYLRGSSKAQVNIWQWPIGSGEVWGYRTDEALPADVRAKATPLVAADQPVGQWNRFLITMQGEELAVELNGQTVIDHCQLPGVPARGPIALQHHGDAIEFANIFIRPLN